MTGKRMFGALTIAAALFALWPAVFGGWAKVNALRDGVSEREELLSQRRTILANVAKVYEEYQAQTAQEDGRNLLAIVPVKKDSAELVSALQAMASQTGVRINELKVSEPTAAGRGEATKVLNIGVDLTGAYSAMRAFLDAMEQEMRLLNVSDITVADDPAGALRFSITAETYFID
jgi:Tfp pilus assembly protein PilO